MTNPDPSPASVVADPLEQQEFYELMQAYRHAPLVDQAHVVLAFEAVKIWIRQQRQHARTEAVEALKPWITHTGMCDKLIYPDGIGLCLPKNERDEVMKNWKCDCGLDATLRHLAGTP